MNTKSHRFFFSVTSYLLIFCAGMALELRSIRPFFSTPTPEWMLFRNLILGHITANFAMALALYRLLPRKYRTSSVRSFFSCFLLGLFLPILASLGLLVVFFIGRRHVKNRTPSALWQVTAHPLQANRAKSIRSQPKFGGHGMPSRLRKSTNPNDHLGIVLATRFMRDENAVPLLKAALKSHEDDVRLPAFSLLEKRFAEINSRIVQLQHRLHREGKKAKIHVAIAHNYLRLVILELIQEEMKNQALNKARQHLQEALREDAADRKSHFILGQVLLEQGEVEQAQSALMKALDLGFAKAEVYPLLAKAAHLLRQFHYIPEYIEEIPAEHRIYPPLAHISTSWLR